MKRYINSFSITSLIIFGISLIVYFLSVSFVGLADLINSTVSVAVRFLLASLTYVIPFSLFELLIILSPVIITLTVAALVRRGRDATYRVRSLVSLISVISLILTSYIFTLGIGYRTTTLGEKMEIEDRQDISNDELYLVTEWVVDRINLLSEKIPLSDGETRMDYSVDELSKRLVSAYDKFNGKYSLISNFSSRVKPVYFSTVMSDLRTSGIYSFFTGEANVNVEYPDYCLPYTAAHELAHQRGICRENEANFVAFLVCIGSDDEYIRYSGYLNIYEYLSSALYSADPELYYQLRSELSETAISDMKAASAVYNAHKDSPLGKLNDRLNDAYLKANGTEGVVSYGYVVRLAVGYYQKENNK